jgi:hypothetical protein
MSTVRNPIARAYFVNAKDGTVTKLGRKGSMVDVTNERFLRIWGKKRETIVIFVEEMIKDGSERTKNMEIPFYFEHKVADSHSLLYNYWKLRGYHTASKEPDPAIKRTPFIKGCENYDDILSDKKTTTSRKEYTCPYPPYAPTENVSSRRRIARADAR